jgi:hypothetical protein
MKVIITIKEALERNIWNQVAAIAGRISYLGGHEDVNREIILTEEQAIELGLLNNNKS